MFVACGGTGHGSGTGSNTDASPTSGAGSSTDASSTSGAGSGTWTTGSEGTDGATSTASVGTEGSSTTEGGVADCHDVYAESVAQGTLTCLCQVEDGQYPDVETCLADFGLTPELEGCICLAFAADPNGPDYLQCWWSAMHKTTGCLQALECGDEVGHSMCDDAFANDFTCAGLADPTLDKLSICYGQP